MGKILQVALQHQNMTNWCWAAVTLAVANYYSNPDCGSQCQWVSRLTMLSDLCRDCPNGPTANSSRPCNITHPVGDSLLESGHLNGSASDGVTPTRDLVVRELDAGRPLVGVIDLDRGISHAVVLYGYTDEGLIYVGDPEKPETAQTMHADFLYPPNGACRGVFCTKPKDGSGA